MAIEKYIKNYIDGTLMPSLSGRYLDNINPATGKVYSYLPDCGEADLERAVEAAENAFPTWAVIEPERRFRILMRIADVLEQNLSDYAKAETIDTGRPLNMTLSQDIPWAQACLRYYATGILHFGTASDYYDKRNVQVTLHQPIGIVGCIIPWNMPIYELCRKVAPALATGNCVVVKPSQWSPMLAYLFAQACAEVGLPAGVLNIVHGSDSVLHPLLVSHPKIKAIAFTGSAVEGKQIAAIAGAALKKTSITIGGNNPVILFADCDFDEMMVGVLRSAFSNNGHLSHHSARILVERSLYDKFKKEFVKRSQFLKVGDPFSSLTDLGAIISEAQLGTIEGYMTLAELEGGTVLCGGKRVAPTGELQQGFFWRPTVIEGVANNAKLNQEELYAPIVTIQVFDTLEEVIALANETQYGLSASIWSSNAERANIVVEQLKARTIWLNAWLVGSQTLPMGGVIHSSLGLEGGQASLDFFTESKHVSLSF